MFASDLRAIPGFTDPFSSVSHLIGAAAFAVMGVALVRRALRTRPPATGSAPTVSMFARVASLLVFSISAVVLLGTSGTFHLLSHTGSARAVMQRLDHAAIFVLIAGTYTPIHAIMFRGVWRWGMLAFIWTFAALGVVLKSIFFEATPPTFGIVLYVAMGWVGLLSMIALSRRYSVRMIWALLAGGMAYTVGAVIEGVEPRPLLASVIRAHEIFHLAVLIGLSLHWWFIWSISDMTIRISRRAHETASAPPRVDASRDEEMRRAYEPSQKITNAESC